MTLSNIWYGKSPVAWLLWPLSLVYCLLIMVRRFAYRIGVLKTKRLPVPVFIVGNLNVGGTGKTPAVIWLAQFLQTYGLRPGLVARGYGGQATSWPQQVRADSDPGMVGDEPVLLVRRTGCPMAVGPDRVAAAQALLEFHDCDVIISDDGLQHYALGRDLEIVVVDGIRRFGNGQCLPAGPLRESRRRLKQVDFILCNGVPGRGEYAMQLQQHQAYRLDDRRVTRSLESFKNETIHAVAGIGHPQRFFDQLKSAGLEIIEHAFADHAHYRQDDFIFTPAGVILMTEKDAVKCERLGLADVWVVPIEAQMDERFAAQLAQSLAAHKLRRDSDDVNDTRNDDGQ